MLTISELLEEAEHLGDDRLIMPIDIFALAQRFSVHPDRDQAVPRLIQLLDDPENLYTRFAALRALRLILGANASQALLDKASSILRTEASPAIRAEAARLIGDAGRSTPEICAALETAAVSDDTDYVRADAARALAAIAESAVQRRDRSAD